MEELALIPGLGEKKVQRLYNALHAPFRKNPAVGPHTVGSKDSRRGGEQSAQARGLMAAAQLPAGGGGSDEEHDADSDD